MPSSDKPRLTDERRQHVQQSAVGDLEPDATLRDYEHDLQLAERQRDVFKKTWSRGVDAYLELEHELALALDRIRDLEIWGRRGPR